jgi:5-(carboxyamino)imidazole ribonucleotide synthase
VIEGAPVVGCLGGGQLGRMLALAAAPLGVALRCLDPSPDACAGDVCELIVAPYDDPDGLARLADGTACVTFEFENVPAAALTALRGRTELRPGASSLTITQDRVWEKQLFGRVGVPCTAFGEIDALERGDMGGDLGGALARSGLPAVIKTKRFGYDGKGQRVVHTRAEAEQAVAQLGDGLIAEALVDFRRELSLVLVRGLDGEIRFYPLVENAHRDGILWTTTAPAPGIDPDVQAACEGHGRAVAEALHHVGTLCIELFETADGILANEIAPRVHNSGHWTIEGAETSQFENHLRAVLGLPLGSTAPVGRAQMVNLVGEHPPLPDLLQAGGHVHLYGKAPRAGRKLGHVTRVEAFAR